MSSGISRRQLLQAGASAAALGSFTTLARGEDTVAKNKRVKQSIVQWCYAKERTKFGMGLEELCLLANKLGCPSIELAKPADWPTLKKHGLTCAIAGSHGFEKGMNNPAYHDMCIDKLTAAIEASAEAKVPSVITFTGFREKISDEDGIKNCVAGYKKIVGLAEKKNVTLCLEMLNSKVNEPMKGHPGYQGDHTEYCIDIIKKVGSPRLKLLFDIYHVQIMDGDVIARIKQHAQYIGHVHTAGNPGRGELDNKQEINYPPIMKALVDVRYEGYVGQEFIPTRDVPQGLTEAVKLCDV